jgi:hypothetical protein
MAKYKDMAEGWAALQRGDHPFASKRDDDANAGRARPNKHESYDHETYKYFYKTDLNKVGCIPELTTTNAHKFWPKDKLKYQGKNKKGEHTWAPTPMSNGQRKEYLRRHLAEKGWTFAEAT